MHERTSRADIVRYIQLTFPQVSRIVGEMLEDGYLREAEYRRAAPENQFPSSTTQHIARWPA